MLLTENIGLLRATFRFVPGTASLYLEFVHHAFDRTLLEQIGRTAYLWAWPMINIENRLLTFRPLKDHGLSGGVLPVGPVNELTMLTDYIEPSERAVACPNQDVVYGQAVLDMTQEPVIVQVPDFGGRFYVYQLVDQRTDAFADIGAMYATTPGFYLLTGPDWNGTVPKGITKVFRSPTNVGFLVPRVFREDTDADKQAIQPLINQIMSYPLSRYTGQMQIKDWSKIPKLGGGDTGDAEVKWVKPETFFDELPELLANLKPMPGEEALYGQVNRHSSDSRWFEARIALSGVFGNGKSRVACAAGGRSSR
jgi:hypothetical protein